MTEFLCTSLITDAAKFDDGKGIQSKSIEYLRSREGDKVITEDVEEMGKSLLEKRDQIYRILCTEFSTAKYDMDDEDSIESTIREIVSVSTIRREIDGTLPTGIDSGLEALEEELIQNMEIDPLDIVSNIRKNVRSRNTDVKDYLEERVRNVKPGGVNEIDIDLREQTESEVVARTCADAAGWWTPRPKPVPLAIGQKSEIESNLDTIQQYFRESQGSPTGVDLIKVESQQVAQ